MRVTLDGTQIFAHIDGAYRSSNYPSPQGQWELKKSRKLDKVYDITEQVKTSVYQEQDH